MSTNGQHANARHDVAIIGAGLAGSMLGAILARNGADVAILDAAAHPRFTLGESHMPDTQARLRGLAERFGVPEIKALSSFENCTRIVRPAFGVNRHAGFLLHHEGRPQDPREVTQYDLSAAGRTPAHWFRQDTDAYLYHAAVRYGCTARPSFAVAGVTFDDEGVTLTSARGASLHARYVVDASGQDSPVAAHLGLREEPCRFRHRSRSVWNHMLGVPPTDRVVAGNAHRRPPVPWHEGTVHHLFDGGWFWVIPFGNHPASYNPVCSVGLTLDERRHPRARDESPEAEFFRHASRFPDIERQFAGSLAAREWASSATLQYSSRRTVGDRWCLLGPAAAFVDPLFATETSVATEMVGALAWRLLRAVRDGDFSAPRFEEVEHQQQSLLDSADALVAAAYVSFADHDLWSQVFRLWARAATAQALRVEESLRAFAADRRDEHFRALEQATHAEHAPGEGCRKLLDDLTARCDAVEAGVLPATDAAREVAKLVGQSALGRQALVVDDRDRRFFRPALAPAAPPRGPAAVGRAAARGVGAALRRQRTRPGG